MTKLTEQQMLLVKQLREETGRGMMDCKKALYQTNFDYPKAKHYLNSNGYCAHGKLVDYWDDNGNHISQQEYELNRLLEKFETSKYLEAVNKEEYERIMTNWDIYREMIAKGDRTSLPREWFENVIEHCYYIGFEEGVKKAFTYLTNDDNISSIESIVKSCVAQIEPDEMSTIFEEKWRRKCQQEILTLLKK